MIDIRTFLLVLAIGNIGFAMMIAGYSRTGSRHPGMDVWKWARLVQGIAHAFGYMRLAYWSNGLEALTNTLLITGIALEVGAYAVFLGIPKYKRVLVPVTLIAALGFQFWRLNTSSHGEIMALMSLIIAMFTAMMAYLLLRDWRTCSPLQRLIGLNDVLFFFVMVVRAYASVSDPDSTLFRPGVVHSAAFITGYCLLIVNGFGFLLLCKYKDDRTMEELATIDSLTGLLNRRAFFERTDAARALSLRLQKPFALMMLDIDHFKRLNDRFGHATGDEALSVFARTVRGELREHDIMGRLGGEEFALAMPGTDLAGALQAAERLRVAVSEAPVLTDGNFYRMTVSVGVVVVDPNEHINSALARADHALYAAKSGGRDRVESGEAIHPVIRSRA
ncbi:GGDEF domain-containing protein [Pseudoduganella sp. GCM10020061]|uniref:GGDEF domain-containing protein n=1 Tax=Pseudoduganella sp. GCM10020061 TaxID=3317345 RepID=UPI00362878F2